MQILFKFTAISFLITNSTRCVYKQLLENLHSKSVSQLQKYKYI